jgi:hypothetical protein
MGFPYPKIINRLDERYNHRPINCRDLGTRGVLTVDKMNSHATGFDITGC